LSQREITMTGKSIEGFSWGVPSANSGNVICIRRWMTFRWWNWDSGWISSILNTNLLTNFLSYKWRRYEPGQPFLFAVFFRHQWLIDLREHINRQLEITIGIILMSILHDGNIRQQIRCTYTVEFLTSLDFNRVTSQVPLGLRRCSVGDSDHRANQLFIGATLR
jgi:hypothetical protein